MVSMKIRRHLEGEARMAYDPGLTGRWASRRAGRPVDLADLEVFEVLVGIAEQFRILA